ncbi:MAG: hypothetical protein AVDCRST_MAG69-1310, partial [uncultured Solirubrobacteraceae bacterium]
GRRLDRLRRRRLRGSGSRGRVLAGRRRARARPAAALEPGAARGRPRGPAGRGADAPHLPSRHPARRALARGMADAAGHRPRRRVRARPSRRDAGLAGATADPHAGGGARHPRRADRFGPCHRGGRHDARGSSRRAPSLDGDSRRAGGGDRLPRAGAALPARLAAAL